MAGGWPGPVGMSVRQPGSWPVVQAQKGEPGNIDLNPEMHPLKHGGRVDGPLI